MPEPETPYLILEDGNTQPLLLEDRPMLIGRNPANEIVIKNDSVSREHARIMQKSDEILVEDCGSRNGTTLNGQPLVESTPLRDGDAIDICGHRFVFRKEPSSTGYVTVNSGSSSQLQSIRIEPDDSHLSSVMAQIDVASESFSPRSGSDRKLQGLIEVARAMSSTLELSEIVNQMLDCLFQLFDQADRGFVVLLDQHGKPVPHAMKLRGDRHDLDTLVISQTIVDEVMNSGQALLSADATADERFSDGDSIAQLKLRSIMCAPLMNADRKPIGLIQLDSLRPAIVFRDKDLELLSTVAIQGGLAITNSQMIGELVEAAKLKQDLQLAHRVQKSFLPSQRPSLADYEFYDYYKPANHVGGDYFDYLPMDDGKLAVIIADVVGHGVPAALLMSKLVAETKIALKTEKTLREAMRHLNQSMQEPDDKFVTMVVAVLDPASHQVQIINAGHAQPLVRRADGTIYEPDASLSDALLGILEDSDFPDYQIDLQPGDIMFLFTDGMNESINEAEQEYSIARVKQQLAAATDSDPVMVAGGIISDLSQFVSEAKQFDDICVVAFGRSSTNGLPEPFQSPRARAEWPSEQSE